MFPDCNGSSVPVCVNVCVGIFSCPVSRSILDTAPTPGAVEVLTALGSGQEDRRLCVCVGFLNQCAQYNRKPKLRISEYRKQNGTSNCVFVA